MSLNTFVNYIFYTLWEVGFLFHWDLNSRPGKSQYCQVGHACFIWSSTDTGNLHQILSCHIETLSCRRYLLWRYSSCPRRYGKVSLLIYDLQSEDWINTYYMLKGFLKACRPPTVSNEMKYTNEKMTWNTQDTKLSSYVPKANVDHTISGQGTGISTLDNSATTPRTFVLY